MENNVRPGIYQYGKRLYIDSTKVPKGEVPYSNDSFMGTVIKSDISTFKVGEFSNTWNIPAFTLFRATILKLKIL